MAWHTRYRIGFSFTAILLGKGKLNKGLNIYTDKLTLQRFSFFSCITGTYCAVKCKNHGIEDCSLSCPSITGDEEKILVGRRKINNSPLSV